MLHIAKSSLNSHRETAVFIASLLEDDSGLKRPIKFVLSDVYPQTEQWILRQKRSPQGSLSYIPEPLSSTDLPVHLRQPRMIVSSFHHFSPKQAQAIFSAAAQNTNGLLIIEPVERSLLFLLPSLIATVPLVMLSSLLSKKRSIKKLFFSLACPLIPLSVLFDCIVSGFRAYSFDELAEFIPKAEMKNFTAEYGYVNQCGPLRYSYFMMYRN